MNSRASAKLEWAITAEAFDRLLAWLDTDRERAGEKYEEIRRKLIKVFIYRGCFGSEELADETINRVIKRIDEVATSYTGDPILYFYGVAQNVHREYLRKRHDPPSPLTAATAPPPLAPVDQAIDVEHRHACLDECLQRLSTEDRELIVRYYAEERQAKIDYRKGLAAHMHLLPNTLRRRTQRIRERLKACIGQCLKRGAAQSVT